MAEVDSVIFSDIFSGVSCWVPVSSLLTPVALISFPLLWQNTPTKASWEGDGLCGLHFQTSVIGEGRCAG